MLKDVDNVAEMLLFTESKLGRGVFKAANVQEILVQHTNGMLHLLVSIMSILFVVIVAAAVHSFLQMFC